MAAAELFFGVLVPGAPLFLQSSLPAEASEGLPDLDRSENRRQIVPASKFPMVVAISKCNRKQGLTRAYNMTLLRRVIPTGLRRARNFGQQDD